MAVIDTNLLQAIRELDSSKSDINQQIAVFARLFDEKFKTQYAKEIQAEVKKIKRDYKNPDGSMVDSAALIAIKSQKVREFISSQFANSHFSFEDCFKLSFLTNVPSDEIDSVPAMNYVGLLTDGLFAAKSGALVGKDADDKTKASAVKFVQNLSLLDNLATFISKIASENDTNRLVENIKEKVTQFSDFSLLSEEEVKDAINDRNVFIQDFLKQLSQLETSDVSSAEYRRIAGVLKENLKAIRPMQKMQQASDDITKAECPSNEPAQGRSEVPPDGTVHELTEEEVAKFIEEQDAFIETEVATLYEQREQSQVREEVLQQEPHKQAIEKYSLNGRVFDGLSDIIIGQDHAGAQAQAQAALQVQALKKFLEDLVKKGTNSTGIKKMLDELKNPGTGSLKKLVCMQAIANKQLSFMHNAYAQSCFFGLGRHKEVHRFYQLVANSKNFMDIANVADRSKALADHFAEVLEKIKPADQCVYNEESPERSPSVVFKNNL